MNRLYYPLCAVAFCSANTTAAEQVFTENVIVDGQFCAGSACAAGEVFSGVVNMKLSAGINGILFNDTGGTSVNDWSIRTNDTNEDSFYIEDTTADTTPFKIIGTAPDNALFVSADGSIGLGTSLPEADIHLLETTSAASFTLESMQNDGNKWQIRAGGDGFFLIDQEQGNQVVFLQDGAPNGSVAVDAVGQVGLGTQSPDAPLELSSLEAFNFFRISAEGASVNQNVDIVFTQGPLGTGQLRYNIVEAADTPQIPEMTLDADGNMVLTGTLTTTGPTCAGGCDRVFDASYPLPSIAEHAAQMFDLGRLPAIGATVPHAPVNLTERQGNIINSLEHAHIYIGQLHDAAEQDRGKIAQLEAAQTALLARLEALEAR